MSKKSISTNPLQVRTLLHTSDTDPPSIVWLPRRLARVAAAAGVDGGLVTLVLVGDGEMTELHARYKNAVSTTDVLSFDLRDDPAPGTAPGTAPAPGAGEPIEADLVLCVDEANRQSAARRHDARHELLLYAVHGLLHLLGHDDHAPAAAAAMHRREDELLAAVGVGPVYATPARPAKKSINHRDTETQRKMAKRQP